MPLREDLEGTKKAGDIFAAAPVPCPIDCAHNMPQPVCQRPSQRHEKRRTEAQNERPPPARGWLKANCGVPSFDLHFYNSNPEPRRTWHCYTRCSSCGLTTGSISDRRKVNFPKTIYTPRRTFHRRQNPGWRHRHRSGRHCHKVAHHLQCMPTGEFNGHQVCRILATSEPMAALLLRMIIPLPGETNPLQGQRTALGLEPDNLYSLDTPASQGHQALRVYARVCGLCPFNV